MIVYRSDASSALVSPLANGAIGTFALYCKLFCLRHFSDAPRSFFGGSALAYPAVQ
jgi:hypothetical protein